MIDKLTLSKLQYKESWEKAVVVFTKDSFDREYTKSERSYEVNRDNKFFHDWMISSSLFGDCYITK